MCELTETMEACTGPAQVWADEVPMLRGEVDTYSPLTQKPFPVDKGKFSFLQWSPTVYRNHTQGQAPCPVVHGNTHKRTKWYFWRFFVS